MRYWDSGAYYTTIVVGVLNNKSWNFYAQSDNLDSKLPLATQEI